MPGIELRDAGVEFAIYNSRARSIRSDLLRRVGGQIGTANHDRITVQALHGINLKLTSGDRIGLVGHNGAGKTTLLRVFSGAYEPSTGSAVIDGRVSSLLDLDMGMDFELTGRQNIVLRGVFLGLTFKQARELVPEIAEFCELGAFLDVPMRTYSSGMIIRLAFGVSTAVQPDIILLDEMISVGDTAFAAKARARIDQVFDRAHILVLASHEQDQIREFCNRAVLLREGAIVAEGAVDDVLKELREQQQSRPQEIGRRQVL
jgi:ABC-2 type transport system ATP-binding protein